MVNLEGMYQAEVANGSLSEAICFSEEFNTKKDKIIKKVEQLLGYDLFNELIDVMNEEDKAYRSKAFKEGFKSAFAIINEVRN